MKYAGMILLLVSTTLTGAHFAYNAKERVLLCRELGELCALLKADIAFRQQPMKTLLLQTVESRCRRLSFLTEQHLEQLTAVRTCLNREENTKISEFVFSLGKTNAATQLDLISAFQAFIGSAEKRYEEAYRKNARIYITFGIFSGLLIGLIIL